MAADTDKQSFWEHLDVLRAAIVKSLLVAVVFGVAAFCFKEELFAVILAPKDADFITYRLLYSLGGLVTESGAPDFLVKLINTGLAGQFIIHMKAALCAGVLCASSYILYQLFRFVSPALYVNERKYVVQVVGGGYAMFALGVAVSYFLIFPLTFRFLGTYQVSGLRICAGYQKNDYVYYNNSRPETISVEFSDGSVENYSLADVYDQEQVVTFSTPKETSYIRIIINSVYPGTKYEDTCISEIKLF